MKLRTTFPRGNIWQDGKRILPNYIYINGDQAHYADVFFWGNKGGNKILIGIQCKSSE
jgi:hypothetical protein